MPSYKTDCTMLRANLVAALSESCGVPVEDVLLPRWGKGHRVLPMIFWVCLFSMAHDLLRELGDNTPRYGAQGLAKWLMCCIEISQSYTVTQHTTESTGTVIWQNRTVTNVRLHCEHNYCADKKRQQFVWPRCILVKMPLAVCVCRSRVDYWKWFLFVASV